MNQTRLLVLAYIAFISLGLPDGVLGVAWPSVRASLGVSPALLGVPLAVQATVAFGSSLATGWSLKTLGVGRIVAVSALVVAMGAAVYAVSPVWLLFLSGAVLIGLGSGAVDSAVNAFGAQHFSPKHLLWLHAAYGLGAVSGPVVMTAVLARGVPWNRGYLLIAGIMATLSVLFAVTSRWWAAAPIAGAPTESKASPRVPVTLPMLAHAALFFLYTGIEVTAGQWSFSLLTQSRGVDEVSAGASTSAFWGAFLGGRVVLGFIVERVGTVRLLRVSMAAAVVGALLFVAGQVVGLWMIGFAFAPIYPGLMAETPKRFGVEASARAVGLQVSAAIIGVIAVPNLAGALVSAVGLEVIPWLLVVGTTAITLAHEALIHPERSPEGA